MADPTWDGILLAGAAVFAAAVAAWTANRRIERQLDAEAQRLERQLAHDRWMREVEELRKMVDDAAAIGLNAGNTINVLRNQVRWLVEDDGVPNQTYAIKLQNAQDAVAAMQGFVERFELRLGRSHEVPQAFTAWQLAMEEALEWFEVTPPGRDSLRNGGERLTASSDCYLGFMESSRSYVRPDPPSAPAVEA